MRKLHLALAALTATMALSACTATTAQPEAETAPSAAATTSAPSSSSKPASSAAPAGQGTPITITAGGDAFDATINDSQVSRDFLATLPTTLSWERNASVEYITELPAPLTETGPFYTGVEVGDIVYYNPRDSITIIYAPTVGVPTLTKMGQVTSNVDALANLPDTVYMRVELQ
jgi:hypothetical protein